MSNELAEMWRRYGLNYRDELLRPTILDAFCGAGGAAVGYYRAGFRVIGVDIEPQPNYPFDFHQGDALDWLDRWRIPGNVVAVHASPPCQRFSDLAKRNNNADDWPDLIEPVRYLLRELGLPYVIENVEGAPLIMPVTLCGTMFDELSVIRHRLFETNWNLYPPSEHPPHPLVFTHDKRKKHYGKLDQDTSYVQVTGGGNATLANKKRAMGMPWVKSHHEVNEAIPPAYTEFIGSQLMGHLRDMGAFA